MDDTLDATTLSYEGIKEATLLFALYNGSSPRGMGFLQARNDITEADCQKYINEFTRGGRLDIDYFCGCPLKVTIDTNKKTIERVDLYDRDNGRGAVASILQRLR